MISNRSSSDWQQTWLLPHGHEIIPSKLLQTSNSFGRHNRVLKLTIYKTKGTCGTGFTPPFQFWLNLTNHLCGSNFVHLRPLSSAIAGFTRLFRNSAVPSWEWATLWNMHTHAESLDRFHACYISLTLVSFSFGTLEISHKGQPSSDPDCHIKKMAPSIFKRKLRKNKVQTSWRCHQGLFDRWEVPEQRIQTGCWGCLCRQKRGEVRPSAAPPGPGQTSTAPYSSGPPSGRSGRPGSVVPARLPGLPSRWATPPQCKGRSSRLRGPLSPAPQADVPARCGCPGSAAACPGPIPGSRNACPGAGCQIHCYSFVPGGLTSRGQLSALNSTAHTPPATLLSGWAAVCDSSGQCLGITLSVPESVASGDYYLWPSFPCRSWGVWLAGKVKSANGSPPHFRYSDLSCFFWLLRLKRQSEEGDPWSLPFVMPVLEILELCSQKSERGNRNESREELTAWFSQI